MKKKKFNFLFLISLILIVGGLGFGVYSIVLPLIKKASIKQTQFVRIHKPTKRDLEIIELRNRELTSSALSYSPPSLDIIEKKVDSIEKIIKSLATSFTTLGGVFLLFLQIKKSKKEVEEDDDALKKSPRKRKSN